MSAVPDEDGRSCEGTHPWDDEWRKQIASLVEGLCPVCDVALTWPNGTCSCCRMSMRISRVEGRIVLTLTMPAEADVPVPGGDDA